MTTTVAVADGIFSIEDGQPKLLGSRCTNCGNHMFPRQRGCPKCMFDEQVHLCFTVLLALILLSDKVTR